MLGVVRSELVRTRRRSLVVGWVGLTVLFAMLVNTVLFQLAGEGTAPASGPGVTFPTAAELAGSDGMVLGLSSGASLFGVVTLSFWAIATGTDYSTGLIRLLVSAEPRRWRLLVGKIAALALWTAGTSLVALVVTVIAAPIGAQAAGVDTSAWGQDLAPTLLGAWLDLYAALLVWGVIGLVLAVLTRSAAIAIGAGVGYVLVVESVIAAAADGIADWLPGRTLSALAAGGSAAMDHATALGVGAAYVAVGVTAALVVVTRRDVTD